MKHFDFVKISGRWFVDVPYNGSVSDLEMVDGADTFLEAYSEGESKMVHVIIMENEEDYNSGLYLYCCHGETLKFKKKSQDYLGTTYEVNEGKYRGDVWLCPVFNLLMGESPDVMEVGVINPNVSW
jgi:hypothetical protein